MLRLGLVLLIIPSLVLMFLFMSEQNQVQECTAAQGVWNYVEAHCEASGEFPFIPYFSRHPLLVNGTMLLSVIGLLMTVIGLYRPSPKRNPEP